MSERLPRLRPLVMLVTALMMFGALASDDANASSHLKLQGATDLVAFTQNNNVFLKSAAGGGLRTVTTRGRGYGVVGGIVYPWYSWSPDGRYLLLVRWRTTGNTGTLLLLNQQGAVLRTLATMPAPSDFWPTWAIDADQIAYVAAERTDQAYGGLRHMVYRMDVAGRRTPLFTYRSHEGCGGGTGDPAEVLYWGETGFGGNRLTMTWSLSQGVAAYTASCAGGVNLTDLRSRRTRTFRTWSEPALSRKGELAVIGADSSATQGTAAPISIVDAHTGGLLHRIAAGELPAWSESGNTIYFVHRTPGSTLHAVDAYRNHRDLRIFQSAVFQARADGAHVTQLFSTSAFGLGALNPTRDGRALIFSQVDNDWALWRHRTGNVLPSTQGPYAPRVHIVRLNIGANASTLAANAGSPAVQP